MPACLLQVLPESMALLCPPSADGLLEALEAALIRVRDCDPQGQHVQVSLNKFDASPGKFVHDWGRACIPTHTYIPIQIGVGRWGRAFAVGAASGVYVDFVGGFCRRTHVYVP